jgi:hypothetical protein
MIPHQVNYVGFVVDNENNIPHRTRKVAKVSPAIKTSKKKIRVAHAKE